MGMAGDEDVAVSEAVRYFTANGGGEKMNGGLCIFAAGNNGEEGDFYPGCLDEAVAVGALLPTEALLTIPTEAHGWT